MIAQGKCTTKAQVGSAMSKEGAFSEHRDVTASRVKAWGVYVETQVPAPTPPAVMAERTMNAPAITRWLKRLRQ
jgi:hypothetical protein